MQSKKIKSKIVLHACCAVCGAYLTVLLKEKFEPVIFFYNPNVQPEEEYKKRKESAEGLAKIYGLEFEEGKYEPDKWLEKVRGLEKEPEGKRRCLLCFEARLRQTAIFAKSKNIGNFSSTLAASPYKNEKIIAEIGKKISQEFGLNFLDVADISFSKSSKK